ncbi:MAG: protoporphyrinogen oxidase [Acidimicrobiales bacterium]
MPGTVHPTKNERARRFVVIGGGIAGLAAAHELLGHPGVAVTVCEAGERLGGKVRTEDFAGVGLDLGPDAFLARRPEAVQLCRELGLDHELVAPATTTAYLWSRGRLRRLPEGLVLGVPTRLGALARSRVLSPLGVARAAVEPLLVGRPLAGDAALGAVVRRRLGNEVHHRLVDPLVGGINAGDTDRLSIEVAAPTLAAAARRRRSLVAGARAIAAAASGGGNGAENATLVPPERSMAGTAGPPAPVFLTLPGGLGRLVGALAERVAAGGGEARTSAAVSALQPTPDGRYLVHTPSENLEADAVIVAIPAPASATLLAPHAPEVAATLAAIDYASVTLVALAFPPAAIRRPLDGSGFLVARGEGRLMTACSWASSKWPHLGPSGQVVLRVSAGRAGDERAGALDDGALVDRLRLELGEALGIDSPPGEVRVTRWHRAFPQYAPGHLVRMAAAEAALAEHLPGVALAGAALAGVGLPACIASGRSAAIRVV